MTPKGFTLIETMIAVTILSLSITGPLLSASRAIVLAQSSRDQLTASYLAQEAIEYVRAMRDNSYLQNAAIVNGSVVAWTDFVTGASDWSITACIASTCTLDPARPMGFGAGKSLAIYSGNAPLYLSNGIYTQQQIGTRTNYTRTIRVTTVSPHEESITSTVSWNFHNMPYTIVVTDHLTPWQ